MRPFLQPSNMGSYFQSIFFRRRISDDFSSRSSRFVPECRWITFQGICYHPPLLLLSLLFLLHIYCFQHSEGMANCSAYEEASRIAIGGNGYQKMMGVTRRIPKMTTMVGAEQQVGCRACPHCLLKENGCATGLPGRFLTETETSDLKIRANAVYFFQIVNIKE